MKKFMMTFLKRGALFAGAGPIILVIVYACLLASGVAETVTGQTEEPDGDAWKCISRVF